jgi:hypothetical protein
MVNTIRLIVLTLIILSCEKSNDNENPFIPDVRFEKIININLPTYNDLKYNGGSYYINGLGVKGVILFNLNDNINFHFEMAGYLFIASYILAIGFNYRKALRRLRKPVFWSQLIVIVILSALFWNFGKADHQWFSREGFVIGFEMLIRALFIVVAFSAISVELLNEHVRHFLVQIGFGQFYKSLGMAFGALPIMISLLPKTKEIIRTPIQSLLKPLVMADQWLAVFKKEK